MSVDRAWLWTCDRCKLTVSRFDHGLPAGWLFVKDMRITHRCPECQDDVPAARRGVPVLVADR